MGEPDPVALGRHGPWVVTTLEHARAVLMDPVRFDFPADVSRRALDPAEEATGRSPRAVTPPLSGDAVVRGTEVFAEEMTRAGAGLDGGAVADAMVLLREPVARSTTAAVLPDLTPTQRHLVADRVLLWIDALAPVIASRRPLRARSRIRREEDAARAALEAALAQAGVADPPATGVVLAAGIQVPIAAGSWLLVKLAQDAALADQVRARPELARAVAWETVRTSSPTWITARIATEDVELGEVHLRAGSVVMVSPLLLGRLESLAPGTEHGASTLDRFDPLRWDQDTFRPGAWLPFGAGPHTCPGRNLGMAQLTHLAEWIAAWRISPTGPVFVDQSRGIFPRPARLEFEPC